MDTREQAIEVIQTQRLKVEGGRVKKLKLLFKL